MADPIQGVHVICGEEVALGGGVRAKVTRRDLDGYILEAEGATLPSALPNFKLGAVFLNTSTGKKYVNLGSASSCSFKELYSADTTGVVQYAEVAVSIAEMKLLNSAPKTLVAAPGAGKVLEFLGATFIYDYAAVFTESTDDLVVRFTDASGAIASTTLDATGLLDQSADQLRTFKPITTDLTPVANSPLVLHNSGNGEYGGTGSPCRVKVAYRVHSTGL